MQVFNWFFDAKLEFQCVSTMGNDYSVPPAVDYNENYTSIATQKTQVCGHNTSTLFLFVGMAFYTVACNLLILNMIIATFT